MRIYIVPGADEAVQKALVNGVTAAGHQGINDPFGEMRAAPLAAAERNVFLGAVDRMLEAEAVLADATTPSATVGWCAAWFLAKGRLVVITCRRDERAHLTPMRAGNPSPWQRMLTYESTRE